MRKTLVILLFPLFFINGLIFSAPENSAFSIEKTLITNPGSAKINLTIHQEGYYSIQLKSKTGASLQLIDKMNGPGIADGVPGEADGRLDTFLEKGDYKIKISDPADTGGEVSIQVVNKEDINKDITPILKYSEAFEGELKDGQAMYFWIEVKAGQPVLIYSEGRSLQSLNIWKDGVWLVNRLLSDRSGSITPSRPKPFVFFAGNLEPGWYKIAAAGGIEEPWSIQSKDQPFRIVYGALINQANSYFSDQISSSGINFYLFRGNPDYMRLSTQDKEGYAFSAGILTSGMNIRNLQSRGYISSNTRMPESVLNTGYASDQDYYLSIVSGKPGKPVRVQTLMTRRSGSFSVEDTGNYWVSTIHSGSVEDSVDATGLLIQNNSQDIPLEIDAPGVDSKMPWVRKCNLLTGAEIFIDIKEEGDYEASISPNQGALMLERYFLRYPHNYVPPEYKKGAFTIKAEKGLHILRIKPNQQGIFTITVKKKSILPFGSNAPEASQGAIQLPSVGLKGDVSYTLITGNKGDFSKQGYIIRKLPLNLDDSLPVYLLPDVKVQVPFYSDDNRRLKITFPEALSAVAELDGQKVNGYAFDIKKGSHTLTLTGQGNKSQVCFVRTDSVASEKNDQTKTDTPAGNLKYLQLKPGEKVWFDLKAHETKTVLLAIDRSAAYRIESLGRLKLAGRLNSKSDLSFYFNRQSNGPGRNFTILGYLKAGMYRLTVEALDKSAGHSGVSLAAGAYEEDTLQTGKVKKKEIKAGQVQIYGLTIPENGSWRVQASGMDKNYLCRLEDREGFPVRKPGTEADFEEYLTKDSYKLAILPPEKTGRITLFTGKEEPVAPISGKGPFTISLNKNYDNYWKELDQDGRKSGDNYRFYIPAEMNVRINLTADMKAFLYTLVNDKRGKKTDELYPDKPFQRVLPAGHYELDVSSLRPDNMVAYTIGVYTEELSGGLEYSLETPFTIPVRVEEKGLAELYSKGKKDIYGILYDSQGNELETADDADFDWNFIISRQLDAGTYYLKVLSRNNSSEPFTIGMRVIKADAPRDISTLPFKATLNLDGKKKVFQLPKGPRLCLVSWKGGASCGISADEINGKTERELVRKNSRNSSLVLYLQKDKAVNLSLWPIGQEADDADLNINEIQPSVEFRELPGKATALTLKNGSDTVSIALDKASALHVQLRNQNGELVQGKLSYYSQSDTTEAGAFTEALEYRGGWLVPAGTGKTYLSWSGIENVSAFVSIQKSQIGEAAETLDLDYNCPLVFEDNSAPKDNVLTVLLAEGVKTVPLVSFTMEKSDIALTLGNGIFTSPALSIKGNSCLSAAFSEGKPRICLWNGDPKITRDTAGIRVFHFNPGKEADLPAQGVLIPAGKSRLYRFPVSGQKRIQTSVSEGMAVITYSRGTVLEVFHSGRLEGTFETSTEADGIAVVNYSGKDGWFTVQAFKGEGLETKNSPVFFEKRLDTETAYQMNIGPMKDGGLSRLFQYNGTGTYRIINSKGDVLTGSGSSSLPIGPGQCRLFLNAGKGFIKVFTATDPIAVNSRWGFAGPSGQKELKEPVSAKLTENPAWYQISVKEDVLFRVSSSESFAWTVLKDGKWLYIKESMNDKQDHFIMKKGTYQIGVRRINDGNSQDLPVSDGSDSGTVWLDWQTTTVLTENVGPADVLLPGSFKAYSFNMKDGGDVGIGALSDNETSRCYLYSENGRQLASGKLLFRTLDAGKYIVVVGQDRNKPACRFKPVVVGIESLNRAAEKQAVRKMMTELGFLPPDVEKEAQNPYLTTPEVVPENQPEEQASEEYQEEYENQDNQENQESQEYNQNESGEGE